MISFIDEKLSELSLREVLILDDNDKDIVLESDIEEIIDYLLIESEFDNIILFEDYKLDSLVLLEADPSKKAKWEMFKSKMKKIAAASTLPAIAVTLLKVLRMKGQKILQDAQKIRNKYEELNYKLTELKNKPNPSPNDLNKISYLEGRVKGLWEEYRSTYKYGEKLSNISFGKDFLKLSAKQIGDWIEKIVSQIWGFYTDLKGLGGSAQQHKAEMKLGAGLIVAVLLYASYKLYKNFLSKAARACKGKSGADKKICMNMFKIKALQTQIRDLQQASKTCSSTSNIAKCKKLLSKKIDKLNKKIENLKSEISKMKQG